MNFLKINRLLFVFLFFTVGHSVHLFGSDPVLDSSKNYIIREIITDGNKTTKRNIIIRELTFSAGDTISVSVLEEKMEKSRENLLNTALFNYVTFKTFPVDSIYIFVIITLEERWYIWPNPIFEHADRNLSAFFHDNDWTKINYGFYWIHNNFRGRKETLRLVTKFGFKQQFGIYYEKPNFDREQKHGLVIDCSYFRLQKLYFETEDNKPKEFKLHNYFLWKLITLRLVYTYRPKYYTYHKFSFGYNVHQVADTVVKLNPGYLGDSKTTLKYMFGIYQFIYDKRDIKAYPLEGYWIDILIKKDGFGTSKIENFSNFYFQPLYSYFGKIADRWYYSFGIKGRYSLNKKLPYTKKAALGYSDFMHGFEYNVIDGPDFILSKNYIKFQLLAPKVIILDRIPLKKFNKIHYAFYLNCFLDLGYVNDRYYTSDNFMVNKFLYSTGVGLDYVTYYDQVFRFEYSINRFGDHGFFIHVYAPILKSN